MAQLLKTPTKVQFKLTEIELLGELSLLRSLLLWSGLPFHTCFGLDQDRAPILWQVREQNPSGKSITLIKYMY